MEKKIIKTALRKICRSRFPLFSLRVKTLKELKGQFPVLKNSITKEALEIAAVKTKDEMSDWLRIASMNINDSSIALSIFSIGIMLATVGISLADFIARDLLNGSLLSGGMWSFSRGIAWVSRLMRSKSKLFTKFGVGRLIGYSAIAAGMAAAYFASITFIASAPAIAFWLGVSAGILGIGYLVSQWSLNKTFDKEATLMAKKKSNSFPL